MLNSQELSGIRETTVPFQFVPAPLCSVKLPEIATLAIFNGIFPELISVVVSGELVVPGLVFGIESTPSILSFAARMDMEYDVSGLWYRFQSAG
jgi:hypothetical protein